MVFAGNAPQAIVEDSGSTNIPGLRVAVDPDGQATVEERNGQIHHVRLDQHLVDRFMSDLKETGPLSAFPARHCVKSVSFGSRMTVQFNGEASPDLNCPGASDPRMDALQKDAHEILAAARQTAGIHSRRVFVAPAPGTAKQ